MLLSIEVGGGKKSSWLGFVGFRRGDRDRRGALNIVWCVRRSGSVLCVYRPGVVVVV